MSSAATNNDRHENGFQSGRFSDPCYCLSTVEKKKKMSDNENESHRQDNLDRCSPDCISYQRSEGGGRGGGGGWGGSSAVCT